MRELKGRREKGGNRSGRGIKVERESGFGLFKEQRRSKLKNGVCIEYEGFESEEEQGAGMKMIGKKGQQVLQPYEQQKKGKSQSLAHPPDRSL